MSSWDEFSMENWLDAMKDQIRDFSEQVAALVDLFYISLTPETRRFVEQAARQITIEVAELRAAEAGFMARAEQVAEQLPQAAEAAKEIPEDSPVAQAARAMADALRQIDAAKLGPAGVLILLFWLIFYHMSMPQVAGATLFYIVLSDYLKKKD
jgi:hypothetical protein